MLLSIEQNRDPRGKSSADASNASDKRRITLSTRSDGGWKAPSEGGSGGFSDSVRCRSGQWLAADTWYSPTIGRPVGAGMRFRKRIFRWSGRSV